MASAQARHLTFIGAIFVIKQNQLTRQSAAVKLNLWIQFQCLQLPGRILAMGQSMEIKSQESLVLTEIKMKMKTVKNPIKKTATKVVAAEETKQLTLKPAPAKVAAPVKETTTKTTKPAVVTIEAKIDVGFGNILFLRGQGAGLSWERGTPLECVDGKTWRWSAPVSDKLTFKLLLNDAVWAQGEDLVIAPGKQLEVKPRF
jgi:hypothetical protein